MLDLNDLKHALLTVVIRYHSEVKDCPLEREEAETKADNILKDITTPFEHHLKQLVDEAVKSAPTHLNLLTYLSKIMVLLHSVTNPIDNVSEALFSKLNELITGIRQLQTLNSSSTVLFRHGEEEYPCYGHAPRLGASGSRLGKLLNEEVLMRLGLNVNSSNEKIEKILSQLKLAHQKQLELMHYRTREFIYKPLTFAPRLGFGGLFFSLFAPPPCLAEEQASGEQAAPFSK
ncbi:hypothetical protein [Legionella yabuuchiae]|uniref:hypothetical protein n=1 Tax=Legionella yabuuchiae TaxID=376727 RepID=UPI001056BAAC|nr:hypothetical protein [Legionella yabuuchiae]